jgi:hypothetical protein
LVVAADDLEKRGVLGTIVQFRKLFFINSDKMTGTSREFSPALN